MSEKLNDDEYTRETESTCYCYNTESSCNETTVSFLSSITDKVLAPLRRVYSSKTGNCLKQQNQNEPTRNKWLIRRLTDGNTFSKWITTEARCKETRFAINSRMGTRFLDQIFILAKEEAEGGQSRVHSGIVSRWTHRNTGVTRWGRKKGKRKKKRKERERKEEVSVWKETLPSATRNLTREFLFRARTSFIRASFPILRWTALIHLQPPKYATGGG